MSPCHHIRMSEGQKTHQEELEDLVPAPPGRPVHWGEVDEVSRGQGGPGRGQEAHHGQTALSQEVRLEVWWSYQVELEI